MKNHILLVEDDFDISELIEHHLEKAGYTSTIFSNGNDLFDYLNTQSGNLIILDLMLPDMDGFEICKRLRMENHTKEIGKKSDNQRKTMGKPKENQRRTKGGQ